MLSKRKKLAIIQEVQKHDKDTGSAEAQIGLLSGKIKALALHLKKIPRTIIPEGDFWEWSGNEENFCNF